MCHPSLDFGALRLQIRNAGHTVMSGNHASLGSLPPITVGTHSSKGHKFPHFSDVVWEGHRLQEAAVTPDAKFLPVLSPTVHPSQPPGTSPDGKAVRLPGSWEADEAEMGAVSWACLVQLF